MPWITALRVTSKCQFLRRLLQWFLWSILACWFLNFELLILGEPRILDTGHEWRFCSDWRIRRAVFTSGVHTHGTNKDTYYVCVCVPSPLLFLLLHMFLCLWKSNCSSNICCKHHIFFTELALDIYQSSTVHTHEFTYGHSPYSIPLICLFLIIKMPHCLSH